MKKDVARYLQMGKTLQLATSVHGQPWICTVYYVTDSTGSLYWLSYPTRRHSVELSHNSRVAATVVVKAELPVIGIQIEGVAELVQDPVTVKAISEAYVAKYDAGKTFYERFIAGKNHHALYVLRPTAIYLFDEEHTASSDRQLVS